MANQILKKLNEKKMNLDNYKVIKSMSSQDIKPDELRMLLLYVRTLVEVWALFLDVGLNTMDSEEFDVCVSKLHCWGIVIRFENRKKLFKLIDRDNSKQLNFLEFSDFVVKMLFSTLNEQ